MVFEDKKMANTNFISTNILIYLVFTYYFLSKVLRSPIPFKLRLKTNWLYGLGESFAYNNSYQNSSKTIVSPVNIGLTMVLLEFRTKCRMDKPAGRGAT